MRTARSMIHVDSLADYKTRVREYAIRSGTRVGKNGVVDDPRTIHPRIEHGRWLVDCPSCGAGIAVEPEWTEVGCIECAHWFVSVAMPFDRHALEEVLVERPDRKNQNWVPGETLQDLKDENAARLPPVEIAVDVEPVDPKDDSPVEPEPKERA